MKKAAKKKISISILIVVLLVSAMTVSPSGCCAEKWDIYATEVSGEKANLNLIHIPIPVGAFEHVQTSRPCGFLTENELLPMDDHKVFDNPQRYLAQLICFEGDGFLEYKIVNPLPQDAQVKTLNLFFEVSAVTQLQDSDEATDLSIYINNKKICTHTIKGDFDGRKGKYPLPSWWPEDNTQYGKPIFIEVRYDGSYITEKYDNNWAENQKDFNSKKVSDIGINELELNQPFFTIRIGVDKDAEHKGGMNLFGEKFGDYSKPLTLSLRYTGEKIYQPKIAEIIDDPAKFENKTVLLTVHPGGWSCSSGKSTIIPEAEGFSRSSTMVYDDTGCLYHRGEILVVGKVLAPELHLAHRSSKETIVIKGKIKLDKNKVPYISGSDVDEVLTENTSVPAPLETSSEASTAAAQALTLFFPYSREEFHPFKDYLGEGNTPEYHFNIDDINKIYIFGSLRLGGILVIDPAQKNSKILPIPVQPFITFFPDIKNDSIYFLITQGTSKENEVILARVEVTGTETISREEIHVDIPPAVFRSLNVTGNRIYITGNKVYLYDGVFSHLLAAIKNGTLEKVEYLKFFGCPGQVSGNFYKLEIAKEEHIKPEYGLIEIFSSSGNLLRSIKLKVPGLVSIDFLGEDEEGNFYIQVERTTEKGIELEVYKFNAAGNHLATLNIPNTIDLNFWSDRLLLVGKDGTVWQIVPTDNGWQVNKWNM